MMLNMAAVKCVSKYVVHDSVLTKIVDRTTTEDLMVSLALNFEGGLLVRTMPCQHSIADYFADCQGIRSRGLAARPDWGHHRINALREIHDAMGAFNLQTYNRTHKYLDKMCTHVQKLLSTPERRVCMINFHMYPYILQLLNS